MTIHWMPIDNIITFAALITSLALIGQLIARFFIYTKKQMYGLTATLIGAALIDLAMVFSGLSQGHLGFSEFLRLTFAAITLFCAYLIKRNFE